MPALSPQSRYDSPPRISRSALRSSSSLDNYGAGAGSFRPLRPPIRPSYSEKSSSNYEYKSSKLTSYDSIRVREKKSYDSNEYGRTYRTSSITESEFGTSRYPSRYSSRSGDAAAPRSRDPSVPRGDFSRSTQSEAANMAEFYEKYSPSSYKTPTERLSAVTNGVQSEGSRSGISASEAARSLRRLRLPETERQRAGRAPPDPGLAKSKGTSIPRAKIGSSWSERKSARDGYRDSLSVSDDNGNDLSLGVNEIRRKFDAKMTVTKLPARDPELGYGTARSSDNIYGQLRNGSVPSLSDERPVPVHKPTSSDRTGTTGSLKWEFSAKSPGANGDVDGDSGYVRKRPSEVGGDASTIYVTGKMNGDSSPLSSVKSQLNANVIGKILEKSTAIHAGNGDAESYGEDALRRKNDGAKNVLSIEIGSERSLPRQTKISSRDEEGAKKTSDGVGEAARSKHTSDFASYIQISAPSSAASPQPPAQKRQSSAVCNGDDGPSLEEASDSRGGARLFAEEDDGAGLRYIDSEPSLDSESRLFADCDGKDDAYAEEGFENKTFEHANGRALARGLEELDFRRSSKTRLDGTAKSNGDPSDDEGVARKTKENDCNSNNRYSRTDSSSPTPDTPLTKRKYRPQNGESPSSLYQSHQNDSSINIKSTSPINALSSSTNSISNNFNSNSSCGSLTTSRRRSIDSKSPQPGSGDHFSKNSGLNGLKNIGNTCFMNSVIQCLSNTRPLLEYCASSDSFSPNINTTLSCMKGALIKAFSTVITELWKADEKDSVVNTTALKTQIQRFAPRFMGYSQQDAQEFLRYLLEGLHEDVNRVTIKPKPILTEIEESLSDAQKAEEAWQRYLRSEDSRVGDIFVGQLKSSLRCTHCSHTSVTFDPFWDLSLPIPSRTGQLKLTQCLSHFTREEELDGDEKPTCSKCQVRRKCLKWFTVQKFPKVLVLHLKRFSPTERYRCKLNVTVEFPLTGLDMTPYAAATSPSARSAMYNLYAVSNHSGTTHSGHYTAYCKHPYNGEWHEYNDSRVSAISPKNVVSNEAYVLFYELACGSAPS